MSVKTDEKKEVRCSGVLCHISSLAGSEGIGTLGSFCFDFISFLKESGFSLWQVLPIGPTGYGDSPYASISTFAGNPLFIDLHKLVEKDWALEKDIVLPEYIKVENKIDYGAVVYWKTMALQACAKYFLEKNSTLASYKNFSKKNDFWLEDFALFLSIKKFYDEKAKSENVSECAWNYFWDKALACREEKALNEWKQTHTEEIEITKVIQFFFYQQWNEVKAFANKNGIKIIGDIPIFVASDSADFWANQDLFEFDKKTMRQTSVAGVPPDYFSATGQLWGNPLYDWNKMKKTNYSWWLKRISYLSSIFDIVRIDHFRGFESYYQIPFGEKTAVNGKWVKGPGMKLFNLVKEQLPDTEIIAEDLGILTEQVLRLLKNTGFAGMKILQFAFNDNPWTLESEKNAYLPRKYRKTNSVVYTGTHDNDTLMSLLSTCSEQYKRNAENYFGVGNNLSAEELALVFIQEAFKCKAKYCIIPVQDLLLSKEGRMNTPSTSQGNWTYRFTLDDFDLLKQKSKDFMLLNTKYKRI